MKHKHEKHGLPEGWQPIETAPYDVDVLVSGGIPRNPGAVGVVIAHRTRQENWMLQFNAGVYMGAIAWQPLPEVPYQNVPMPYAGVPALSLRAPQ